MDAVYSAPLLPRSIHATCVARSTLLFTPGPLRVPSARNVLGSVSALRAGQVLIGELELGVRVWLADNSLIDDDAASRFLAGHPDPNLP